MASLAYEQARKNKESFMAGGVKIVFPAFDDLPEKILYLGTRNFESADGEEYKSALIDVPKVRSRNGAAQDFTEFAVNDPESVWYEAVKPYEDVFEDTAITVKEFLKTADGVFESEITLEGFLEKFNLNESDLTLSFSGISDMSRTGFPVGGRILSQRFCAARFNKNGLLSPLLDACGWQVGQVGNPVFCTHKRTGADGCEDHNNAHRIFAVEGLTSAQIQYVAGGGIGGGGWEYGGGENCFTPKTLVWMADGTCKPIRRVKAGDLVWSFTPSGELVKRAVLKTFRSRSRKKRHLDFGKSRDVETKDEHFFLTETDNFLPAADLEPGGTVYCRRDETPTSAWFDLALRKTSETLGKFEMCNFAVQETMTYFIVLADGTKIGVHNLKNNFPEIQV